MTLLTVPFPMDLSPRPVKRLQEPDLSAELCRVLHAAVINQTFRNNLLNNPLRSVEAGFCGEHFTLSAEDRRRLDGVQASTLEDFANQLIAGVQPVQIPQVDHVAERPTL